MAETNTVEIEEGPSSPPKGRLEKLIMEMPSCCRVRPAEHGRWRWDSGYLGYRTQDKREVKVSPPLAVEITDQIDGQYVEDLLRDAAGKVGFDMTAYAKHPEMNRYYLFHIQEPDGQAGIK